jgi:phosphoglycolate phosphatase
MKTIVFDFDGVLADTYKFNKNLCEEIGHKTTHEIFKAHHDGNVFEKPKIIFNKQNKIDFDLNYYNGITTINIFFSKENLNKLSKNYNLNIISSSNTNSINKFLKYHNIEYFDEILGDNFHKSKIEKFKYLLKKYNLNSTDCVFITDTLGDILEGHKVNVKSIAVDFGFHDKKRLEQGKPYKIISTFEEMLSEIKNIE